MKLDFRIPENRPYDVVGLGLNAIDHLIVIPEYPEKGTKTRLSKFITAGGGQIGTGLSALARLGLKVKYLGKVGDDEMGHLSLDLLAREGVDISDVVEESGATSQYAFIIVEEKTGERTIMWHRHPALSFRPGDFSRDAVTSGRILHIDGHEVPFLIQAARWAREEGIPILIDAERIKDRTFELLPLGDILIADQHFCHKLYPGMDNYEDVLMHIRNRFNPHFCAVTLGEKGSLGYFQDQFIHIPAYKVNAVDTTGAGDVFHAAFAYGMIRQWDIPDIMLFSSAVAALKCRNYGGREGAPILDEVREFMGDEGNFI